MPPTSASPFRPLRIPAKEWWLAACLVLLALIPSLNGLLRLGGIAVGDPATPGRFAADPIPVAAHIIGALVYSFLGAFQFLPSFRSRNLRWHRFAGRYLLIPSGLVVALSGLWMNIVYVMPPIDGWGLMISRHVVGVAMTACLVLGVVAILRRRFDMRRLDSHGAWMIRAYALAMGAGTQVLTSLPPVILFGPPDELGRLLQMDAGWVINVIVAELVIWRMRVQAQRGRGRRDGARDRVTASGTAAA